MKRYGQYCPVARAAEVLAERWTLLIIRELLWGEDRFNAIHRGLPRVSPSLLAARLRELQRAGLVQRDLVDGEPRYRLTPAGEELRPLLEQMGAWGARWMQDLRPDEFDPVLLMLDISRDSRSARMPERAATVQLHFRGAPTGQERWWLVLSRSAGADVCDTDPGFPISVWLETDVPTLTRIWMGDMSWSAALRDEALRMTGDHTACRALPQWLHVSPFAAVERAAVSLPR
ncbi:helix-turn-helix domain-containing protein [Streptomyces sp. NL15-2K]|uniref:winged helix-turn-helix transcriptional regulator n=1 Tax=Streptomyces sp. NL15-2K TaxID=376149 RepID=UPI000F55A209|nr:MULTISPECIES: helix-turn-helix domain-containing protein [Actinomycetes]WKX06224.1 helix-turn-helix domain-containing protein [Kutzneria buriramensis]GCB52919.1 hxlR family transcriptional regulator [Streptomyces sp. NL15-2K]